jgi:hypothetical protein
MREEVMVDSITFDLTRNIARTLAGLQEEADYAIPASFGEREEWAPIFFYKGCRCLSDCCVGGYL